MAVYVLSYDLRKPGRNYEALYEALRKGKAVRTLQSVWFLESTLPAPDIRDRLAALVDRNDGIEVFEITEQADWAVRGAIPPSANWIKARRP